MKKKIIPFYVVILLLLMMSNGVNAAYIGSGSSTEGLGSFAGDLSYDSNIGILELSLNNTSDLTNGGYITGVAFNNPGGIDGVVFSDPFFGLLASSPVSANPYGDFSFAISLGKNNWEGGGKPKDGIFAGDSKTFTFQFTGPGTGSLTDQSFINALSTGGIKDGQFMAVRFRGFVGGGSDKVAGTFSVAPVPEPGTLAFFCAGIGVLGLLRNRKPSVNK